jgi:hypothetical protein
MDQRDRRQHESGQAIVVFAIFLVVLLCFLGVVIDGGMYYVERRDMQGAADAAALAAIREMPGNPAGAAARAEEYAEGQNGDADGQLISYTPSDNNRSVTVRVGKTGTQNFSAILGVDAPDISATATARVQMMGARAGMLPMAFMRDSFTIGDNFEVKFDGSAGGNRGAIAPQMGGACGGANGANDFRNLIKGSAHGGSDACASPIGTIIDTEPGNMSGPTRQGFDDRLGGDTDSYEDVFTDGPDGITTIDKPDSPRIGIVPIIEQSNGSNTWPNGRKPVRILGYMLVYIGKEDSAGNPAYTNNGKSVWVTPVRPVMPSDWPAGDFVDYDPDMASPVVFRLVD